MIDQGFCFNAGEWNFPDAPLRGLYARHRVYESVRGIESFEPWLARDRERIDEADLDEIAKRDSARVVRWRIGRARQNARTTFAAAEAGAAN